jgi:hypothetical protein
VFNQDALTTETRLGLSGHLRVPALTPEQSRRMAHPIMSLGVATWTVALGEPTSTRARHPEITLDDRSGLRQDSGRTIKPRVR